MMTLACSLHPGDNTILAVLQESCIRDESWPPVMYTTQYVLDSVQAENSKGSLKVTEPRGDS